MKCEFFLRCGMLEHERLVVQRNLSMILRASIFPIADNRVADR